MLIVFLTISFVSSGLTNRLFAQCLKVTTLAGGQSTGYANGTGTAAQFWQPKGAVADIQGNIYISDMHSIRKVTPAGVVTRLAGSNSGVNGFANGTGLNARFDNVHGLAIDATGNIYAADYVNHAVRKITPAGVVTTFAGGPTKSGHEDGPIATAKFYYPQDVAVDAVGNIYVADQDYIRKISPAGIVTSVNSIPLGNNVYTVPISDIAVDASGMIYFTARGYPVFDDKVWQMTPSGVVSLLAGGNPDGASDGIGAAAGFQQVYGLALDVTGNLYVGANQLRRINIATAAVTTIAGYAGGGYVDAVGTDARFATPWGVTLDASGNLYVADMYNVAVRRVNTCGAGGYYPIGATYSGLVFNEASANDGSVTATQTITLNYESWTNSVASGSPLVAGTHYTVANVPAGLTMVLTKTTTAQVQVSFTGNATAHANANDVSNVQITFLNAAVQSGNISQVVGLNGQNLTVDFLNPYAAAYSSALFPEDAFNNGSISATGIITIDGTKWTGNVAVNSLLVKNTHYTVANVPTGLTLQLTKLSDTQIQVGFAGYAVPHTNASDINNIQITFLNASVQLGNVSIVAGLNGQNLAIDFLDPYCNTVTTLAGGSGQSGFANGTGTAAQFLSVTDVVTDIQGNVYVADKYSIRKITPAGVVSRLAGSNSGVGGFTNATGLSARFNEVYGLAIDANGNIYAADYFNDAVRKITPAGVVTTIAGGPTKSGYEDGPVASAKFTHPWDVAVDAVGNIYVGEQDHIRKISPSGIVTTVNTVPFAQDYTVDVSNLVVDANGIIYFTFHTGNPNANLDSRIWQMTPSGVMTLLAGSNTLGSIDGIGAAAQFGVPVGLSLDAVGNLYVADQYASIRRINIATQAVTTIAGSGGYPGYVDSVGTDAKFILPWGVTLDASGNLYVGENGTYAVRRINTCGAGGYYPIGATYSGLVFNEASANDGSVTATQTISLNGTSWTNSIANGSPLVAGTHYTVANVPSGLTMVLTKTTTAQVQISFTGNAAAHANANDISNVQITFLNAAVQNGNAAIVSGLNGKNLTIDFADPAVLPPTISCSAITSTGGNVVLINGTNFTGAISVQFGGVNAQSFTVNSATQITATVAFGSTSGNYTVTTTGGTSSCAMFTYIPTPPIITSFNPAFGVNPSNVTISGTNFLGTTQVTFGGVPATIVSVTNTKIVVTLGVGTVSSTPITVAVTKPDGTATLAGFVYSNVPPIPNITSFSPICGTTGTVITISGTGLSGAKSVTLGGTPTSFVVVSDYEIKATVKTGSTGAITVTSLSGTHSLPGFTYNPLPTISSFTPNNPDAGQTLTINGTNFTSSCSTVQNLYLGGNLVPPGNITIVSPTQLSVVVPANASSGTVQLIRTDNSNATRTGFLFNAPRPISFTPTSGTTGTAVVITGQNFSGTSGAAGVRINGVNAASYTVDSDTQITAYPAASSATTGSIVVTNVNGNGSAGTFTFTPPAIIDGFYTSYGATGATITLYGRNFTNAFLVKFGTMVGSIVSVSPTQIVATVGTSAGTSGPTVSTTLATTTPGGQGVRSGFRFSTGPTVAAPTISSITPQPVAQQNTVLTLTGTNLLTATGVLLNGVPLRFSGTPTATQVNVIIPAGSTDGTITVYTHGGTTTSSVTILPLPTILSFTPTTGPTGTVVTITGSGFTGVTGAASVRFGSTNAASYTVVDNTRITATVAGGATGVITIVAPGGTVTSATNFTYVAPVPAPTITGVSTDIGTTGTVVVISGTNFTGATAVSFGGVAASYTVNSPTQITATVGAGNSGNIVVTTPSGSANSNAALGVNFTYLPHPIPTITSFNPPSRMEGQSVTIVGNYLAGASRITIGGALVTSFVVNGDGSITATVPSGATTGKIIVYKDVVSPTNTLIAQSATDLTIIPLLAFAKGGAETTSGQSLSVLAGVENVPTVGMTVFPNPAQSAITVQTTLNTSGIARLSLLNALGVMVWTAEVPVQAGAFERQIELSNLPSGFYVTELRIGAERLTKRFVKQ